MELSGKTFLVTGGASGLGGACVRRFGAAGANLVAADLNAELGNKLVEEVGSNAIFVETDVTDEGSVAAAVDAAKKAFNGIDGAINCAGIGVAMRTCGKEGPHDLAVFSKVIEVNLIGTFNVIRLVAAAMTDTPAEGGAERGVFVNTASVAAFDGQIGQAAYSASKGGVVGMTLPIARELSKFGIRVVTIAPGLFDTPMMAGLPEEARQSLGAQVPFPPRLGSPEEFAQLAQQIVENPMLNGETIRLDGAIRMAPK